MFPCQETNFSEQLQYNRVYPKYEHFDINQYQVTVSEAPKLQVFN
jgi:hypothetical protein